MQRLSDILNVLSNFKLEQVGLDRRCQTKGWTLRVHQSAAGCAGHCALAYVLSAPAGGTISFDSTANEEVYGSNVTASHLANDKELGSADAPGVAQLHEALSEIAAAAEADPRKFSGFQKRWKPQSVFQEDGNMHVGVDAHAKAQ